MKRYLFVCQMARLRSPTAAEALASAEVETRYAGLSPTADRVLCDTDLAWATHIFVFERSHWEQMEDRFGEALGDKPIFCFHLPDVYERGDPSLIKQVERFVRWYVES